MRKWIVIILSMVCAANLLACSGKKTDSLTETAGMIDEEEIEAIFGTKERKEEKTVSKTDAATVFVPKKENATEMTESHKVSKEGVPAEYSHLFENGDFDENLVWTGYQEEYAELIQALHSFCEESALGSVMLANDEEVIFAGGFNAKEIDGETMVNPFTTYEIGSLTEAFTATAIIQQMQEGNLKASDTLDNFFPDYPYGAEVSVDNLLHMDSGIPDYIDESMKFFAGRSAEEYNAFMNGEMSDEVIVDYLNKSELVFEPGKKSSGSGTNFYLLALILEQITGMTYEEYMQAYLFDACGLMHTTCTETGNITSVPQRNGEYQTLGRVNRGAGDMHSNVCDILMFDRELLAGRIIDEEHLEYMTEARNEYACGWFDAGGDSIGQYGNNGAYICVNFVYRLEEENWYFIMMIPDGTKWAMPGKTMDVLESYLE